MYRLLGFMFRCIALNIIFCMEDASKGRGDNQRNNRHEFNEDVHRGTRRILKRIAYGISRYRSLMRLRTFEVFLAVDLNAFFKTFLGIIPCTTSIVLKHTHEYAANRCSGQETTKGFRSKGE